LLTYLLYGIFILSCLVLIVAVLLQPGKADAGNLFTSSFSSTAFGPRGTQTLLAKITIGAAITFMLAALLLTTGLGEQRSLMEGAGADASATPAASPASSPAASPQAETAPAAAASPQAEGAASPAANTNAGASASPAASPAAQASPETK
jgi:preprotein translocase subunit SecG